MTPVKIPGICVPSSPLWQLSHRRYGPSDARNTMNALLIGNAALSVLFGITAVVLRRLGSPKPKWLVRTFQVLAVLGTLWVMMMIGG